MKAQSRLTRQWQLLHAISNTQRGLTVPQLMAETDQSRSNLYRDLQHLAQAGLPITNDGGRVRLLSGRELPPSGFTALQIAALHLARLQLVPLAGAGFVRELDGLLGNLQPPVKQSAFRFAISEKHAASSEVLKQLERGQRYRRRVAIEYRAVSRAGSISRVQVEPLLFNVAVGEPYVLAYCAERKAERTYKLARIVSAELTNAAATYKPHRAAAESFANAIKAWSGAAQAVRVQLDPEVAWLAHEYPLPNQRLAEQPDGSLVVEAHVAGLVEARRWILGWGAAAKALEPSELRAAVRDELARALQKYEEEPVPPRAPRLAKGKSPERQPGSRKDLGTARR